MRSGCRAKKKYRPFHVLSRRARGEGGIRLKADILRTRNLYGGRFTSHLWLEEPGENPACSQWFDFLFLGSDKYTIWNAYICTARVAFWDKVGDLARERAWELLSPEEQEEESRLDFEPASYDVWGRVKTYTLVDHHQPRPQFGGLMYRDYCEQLEREIIEREPPVVYESFELDRSYAYGTGLYIVADEDGIDRAAIERAIDKFMEVGQTNWRAPNPVPRERLPYVGHTDALKEGKVWTLGLPVRDTGRIRGLDDE